MKIPSFLAASLLSALSLNAAVRYSVTDLGTLPGDEGSSATGINNSGQIVGYSYTVSSSPGNTFYVTHAFVYSNEAMQPLGTLGGTTSSASAINDNGLIIGSSTNADGDLLGFTYSNDAMAPLLPTSDNGGIGNGLNKNGSIVGGNGNGILVANGTLLKEFNSLGGSGCSAIAINTSGTIVGNSRGPDEQPRAFIYTGGPADQFGGYPVTDLTDTITSSSGWILQSAKAINDAGKIVGYGIKDGNYHAYMYTNGIITDLNPATGPNGLDGATAINAHDEIVGETATSSGTPHAFIYRGGVMTDLNSLIPSDSGWELTYASGINDAGQIVGQGFNAQGNARAFLLTPDGNVPPTPTPSPTPSIPTAKLMGKKKITTDKSSYTIKGTATGTVTNVSYRVGSKGNYKKAKGTNKWSFTAKLKPGKNLISVIISSPGGDAKPLKITVTRK